MGAAIYLPKGPISTLPVIEPVILNDGLDVHVFCERQGNAVLFPISPVLRRVEDDIHDIGVPPAKVNLSYIQKSGRHRHAFSSHSCAGSL